MGHKKRRTADGRKAKEIQLNISGNIQDAICEAEKLIKSLPDWSTKYLPKKRNSSSFPRKKAVNKHVHDSPDNDFFAIVPKKKGSKKVFHKHDYESFDTASSLSIHNSSSTVTINWSEQKIPEKQTYMIDLPKRKDVVKYSSKESADKYESSNANAVITSTIQADSRCTGMRLIADLVITKLDGEKKNVKLRLDMPDDETIRFFVNEQEFQRISG